MLAEPPIQEGGQSLNQSRDDACDDENLVARVTVGYHATEQQQEHQRDTARSEHQPQVAGAATQLQDGKGHGNGRQRVAEEADRAANPVRAKARRP